MDKTKIIAALVLLPLFIWLIGWAEPTWFLGAVIVLLFGLGSYEYVRLAFGGVAPLPFAVTLVMNIALGSVVALGATGGVPAMAFSLAMIPLAALLIGILFMIAEKHLQEILIKSAKVFFGVLLIGVCGGMVVALRFLEEQNGGFHLVMLLFATIWVNDSGAFFAGSMYGKHKIAPNLSPNKTIEGNIGGFLATIFLVCLTNLFWPFDSWVNVLVLGAVLGVIGPLGDLFESALKRAAGVKDSGVLLPGHGGVFDRVDSVLFGAPVLYVYVLLRMIEQTVAAG